MYNDGRSSPQAEELNLAGGDTCDLLGYRFASSFALSKALWVYREEPSIFTSTRFFAHQADYLNGRLTGRFDITDYNNALKTGYDVRREEWPDWIANWDGLLERLPQVVAPGEEIGRVTEAASRETGLPSGLKVVAGTTDGIAGFLASGAGRGGDCNTTLGTTLVFKAISSSPVKDENGAIYSHKLPTGAWLPGAASNTGAAWIPSFFNDADPAELDRAALKKLPSDSIAYPLVGRGERFPFLNADAAGFLNPDVTGVDAYAAYLQGTAFIERLAYEELSRCAGQTIEKVYCTGGGSRSGVWTQLRSDVCGIPFLRPAIPEAAFGAAVLAASSFFGSLDMATDKMVNLQEKFDPDPRDFERYSGLFSAFLKEMGKRGYI
jgi:xylulokinase